MKKPLPPEKRTAFDHLGRAVEGNLPPEVCLRLGTSVARMVLLNGFEGRSTGFGLAHIEAKPSRMKQLKGLGYNSAHAFIRDVFQNYSRISLEEGGRLALICERPPDYLVVICQWDAAIGVWSVTTALPKRHMRNARVVWTRQGS